MKRYDYINRVVIMLPLTVYEGTWTTLFPLVAMLLLDRSSLIIGFFFLKYHVPQQWHPSQVYAEMLYARVEHK